MISVMAVLTYSGSPFPAPPGHLSLPWEKTIKMFDSVSLLPSVSWSSGSLPSSTLHSYEYSWTSDNESIAKVSSGGVVTGFAPGSTRVWARYKTLTDSVNIIVEP
jgi:Bacterial Ig-like domain (group 2)